MKEDTNYPIKSQGFIKAVVFITADGKTFEGWTAEKRTNLLCRKSGTENDYYKRLPKDATQNQKRSWILHHAPSWNMVDTDELPKHGRVHVYYKRPDDIEEIVDYWSTEGGRGRDRHIFWWSCSSCQFKGLKTSCCFYKIIAGIHILKSEVDLSTEAGVVEKPTTDHVYNDDVNEDKNAESNDLTDEDDVNEDKLANEGGNPDESNDLTDEDDNNEDKHGNEEGNPDESNDLTDEDDVNEDKHPNEGGNPDESNDLTDEDDVNEEKHANEGGNPEESNDLTDEEAYEEEIQKVMEKPKSEDLAIANKTSGTNNVTESREKTNQETVEADRHEEPLLQEDILSASITNSEPAESVKESVFIQFDLDAAINARDCGLILEPFTSIMTEDMETVGVCHVETSLQLGGQDVTTTFKSAFIVESEKNEILEEPRGDFD
ncbi:hypothetical protein R1sor_012300 [Riccia sorocarpa]|uniref:Uncharacterized protein n=1 Tax=Riccia sorocarpa TaxID=122646 RepID=A0ABD3I9K7_9MARC